MRLVPTLAWSLEGDAIEPLDERLLPLLEAVAAGESLAGAVEACGISYRAAWGLLREYEQKLGVALVLLERGRGASLTQAGEELLEARRTAVRRLARVLPGLATEIGSAQRRQADSAPLRLKVAASHDLALAALADALPAANGVALEISFMGSLHAIREFAEGHADVAGFHVPLAGADLPDLNVFMRSLRPARDRIVRFADREQGLILARENPAHIRSFRDLAAKGLRFVNRQRGSGTRLLIDALLAHAHLDPTRINGYVTEEFTHAAVAATVASGGADAGFGLRAAAAEYRLGFVPLVRERYLLAVRARDLQRPPLLRLLDALRSPAFARLVRPLAGYQAAEAGTVLETSALLAAGSRARR
jgi:molybdate transport repressor ModE-like protein